MSVQQKTWDELVTPNDEGFALLRGDDEFLAGALERLANAEKWPNAEGIVVFENRAMDSSEFGSQAVLPYGLGCTTVPNLQLLIDNPMKYPLGQTPSRFKYPRYYVTRESYVAGE